MYFLIKNILKNNYTPSAAPFLIISSELILFFFSEQALVHAIVRTILVLLLTGEINFIQ
jgi:hypothetical protein